MLIQLQAVSSTWVTFHMASLKMISFFGQFGKVKHLKLFRSEKTGGSKGYAFIEFETPSVAAVVAEAMDGYFIQEIQMTAHVVPKSKQHDGMFKRKAIKTASAATAAVTTTTGAEAVVLETSETEKEVARLAKEEADAEAAQRRDNSHKSQVLRSKRIKQQKLNAMGIDFDVLACMKA